MDTDTITEPSNTCRCAVEVARSETRTYSVAPRDGGGWPAWIAALTRLLMGPAHCLVITQEPNQRYVQLTALLGGVRRAMARRDLRVRRRLTVPRLLLGGVSGRPR